MIGLFNVDNLDSNNLFGFTINGNTNWFKINIYSGWEFKEKKSNLLYKQLHSVDLDQINETVLKIIRAVLLRFHLSFSINFISTHTLKMFQ